MWVSETGNGAGGGAPELWGPPPGKEPAYPWRQRYRELQGGGPGARFLGRVGGEQGRNWIYLGVAVLWGAIFGAGYWVGMRRR